MAGDDLEQPPHWDTFETLNRLMAQHLDEKREDEQVVELENGVRLRQTESTDTAEFSWGTKLSYDKKAGSLAVVDSDGLIVPFKKVGETGSTPGAQILSYQDGSSAHLFEDGRFQFDFAGDLGAGAEFDIRGVTSISNRGRKVSLREPTLLPVPAADEASDV